MFSIFQIILPTDALSNTFWSVLTAIKRNIKHENGWHFQFNHLFKMFFQLNLTLSPFKLSGKIQKCIIALNEIIKHEIKCS